MPFLRYHATVERRIRELGIGFTFLQPNLYFEGLLAFQPVKPPPQTAGRPIPVSRYLDCVPLVGPPNDHFAWHISRAGRVLFATI